MAQHDAMRSMLHYSSTKIETLETKVAALESA